MTIVWHNIEPESYEEKKDGLKVIHERSLRDEKQPVMVATPLILLIFLKHGWHRSKGHYVMKLKKFHHKLLVGHKKYNFFS